VVLEYCLLIRCWINCSCSAEVAIIIIIIIIIIKYAYVNKCSISRDKKVIKKKCKEDSKIQNLTIETEFMCTIKPKLTPVIKGTTERISNYIRKYPSTYPTVTPVTSQRCPVSIKTANRLLTGRSAVRIPAGTSGFPRLQNVHTNHGAHTPANTMGTEVPRGNVTAA